MEVKRIQKIIALKRPGSKTSNRPLRRLRRPGMWVSLLLLVFPGAAILITHAGSALLMLFTLGGLAVWCFSKNRPAAVPMEKWVIGAFALYFWVYLLSFSVNGLLGNLMDPRFKHLDHEIRFLCLFPVLLLLRRFALPEKSLWISIVAGAALSGVWAISSSLWLSPGMRVSGSYHPIAFGDLSLALAIMAIPSLPFFKRMHPLCLLIPLGAFALGATASVLSETRGALIAVPCLLGILFFYSGRYLKVGQRLLLIALCCCVVVAACYIPSIKIVERFEPVLAEVSDYFHGDMKYTPVSVRLGGWRAALDIFAMNPVIGAGPGNFKPLVHRMIAQGRQPEFISIHSQPHSAYLSSMADCGVPGLAALLGLFCAPLLGAFRLVKSGGYHRDLGYTLMIMVASFAHFGLTETIFGRNINISFYIVMTAAVLAAANRETMDRR